MIITIARECGSGGHEIAERLAQDYQMEFYDKKRLVQEAKKKGMFETNRDFLDETPVNSLLYGIAMGYGSYSIPEKTRNRIKAITEEENFVIIGRCSNYIFRDEKDVTSIFIHASKEFCIQRLTEKHGLDQKKAEKLAETYNERRASFHRFCTGEAWKDLSKYQLSLDTGEIGIECAVRIIEAFIRAKEQGQLFISET